MNQNLDLIWAAHATESTGRHYVNSIISLSLSLSHTGNSHLLCCSRFGEAEYHLRMFSGHLRAPLDHLGGLPPAERESDTLSSTPAHLHVGRKRATNVYIKIEGGRIQ